LASEAGKPLRLAAPAGHLEASALAARTHLPLDSL
ncbi:MAG: acetyltransferase, partial [Pseudomonas sp. BRH_c35]